MGWHGITDGKDRVNVETNGSLPVTIQDSTSPVFLLPLSTVNNETLLTAVTAIDDYSFTVADATGFIDKAFIGLNDGIGQTFWFGHQVGAPVGNVITVDRPLSAEFPIGSNAHAGSHNLNVNGSVTPQIFSVRPVGDDITVSLDVTRVIITMFCASGCDLNTFGDLTTLTNGVTLRRVDGTVTNLFNFKNNGELAGLCFDMTIWAATNPQQGIDGITARLTFASQGKMGSVIRIAPGEDLQCIVNDDLRDLTRFHIIAEGSLVTEG